MSTATVPMDVRLMQALTRLLMWALAGFALSALGWWAYQHPAWKVREIVLVGDVVHQSGDAMRAQLSGRLKGSYLSFDVRDMQAFIEEMPWVRKAVVQRVFPDRVRITLSEQEAHAWWGEPGAQRLVNSYGELFEASGDDAPGDIDQWPVLDGPVERSADVYAMYLSLNIAQQGGWELDLKSGTKIALGSGTIDAVLARVKPFTQSISELLSRYDNSLLSVDLRYSNGYAVRLRGVTTGGSS
jgi:cell division protein FtsQ